MGNCWSSSDYITPRPTTLLPDPSGPSTFTCTKNSVMSNNYNVFQGADENAPLWLFLHVRGTPSGENESYFVLENFWRPPFSEEGDVICWCHLPAYQKNQSYQSSGHEEYGISPDVKSEIYWSDSPISGDSYSIPMLYWKRREWEFSIRIGFYRDRYMEEPLGVLDVWSKGWVVQKVGGPGKNFVQPRKEIQEVRYVFRDKHGLRYPICLDAILGGSPELLSYDCPMFNCLVTPAFGWLGEKKVVLTSKSGSDPSLAFLVGFVCSHVLSPEDIAMNLRIPALSLKKVK